MMLQTVIRQTPDSQKKIAYSLQQHFTGMCRSLPFDAANGGTDMHQPLKVPLSSALPGAHLCSTLLRKLSARLSCRWCRMRIIASGSTSALFEGCAAVAALWHSLTRLPTISGRATALPDCCAIATTSAYRFHRLGFCLAVAELWEPLAAGFPCLISSFRAELIHSSN